MKAWGCGECKLTAKADEHLLGPRWYSAFEELRWKTLTGFSFPPVIFSRAKTIFEREVVLLGEAVFRVGVGGGSGE